MKNMKPLFMAVILFAFCLCITTGLSAGEKNKRTIELTVKYGQKGVTERDYEFLSTMKLKTPEGKMVEVKKKDLSNGRGYKIQITPTIGKNNPELIIMKIKAWELRTTKKDEKMEYVEVLNQTSRVARNATMMATEKAGIDRDIAFTIRPTYKKGK